MIGEPWGKAPCSCGCLKLKRRREVSKEDEGIDPTTGSVAGQCLLKYNRDAIATVNLTKFN